MFDFILVAAPSFYPCWASFLREWDSDPDPPLYVALGSLARLVIKLWESGDVVTVDAVLGAVEDWYIYGDIYVQEAATIGLLEAIQNNLGNNRPKLCALRMRLGTEACREWDNLTQFWEGDGAVSRSSVLGLASDQSKWTGK
ncbi:DUF7674 family protein [Asaia astilbis]